MKLTSTNLFSLRRLFNGATVVENRIERTSLLHIRRCMILGLVEITDDNKLALTASGLVAVSK
jgi:hypothetical protein